MNRNEDGHVSDDIQVIKNIVNSDLNETTKNKTIKKMMNNNEGDDGFMDKIFGKKHPDIYVTMVI